MTIPTPEPAAKPVSDPKAKMTKEEVVGFLNDMIDALTWKRVGLLSLLAACVISLLVVFENRTTLFNKIVDPLPVEAMTIPWELSDASKGELLNLTHSQPILGGVVVMEVNLKKNRSTIKFWDVKDPALRAEATKIAATILPQAFFRSEDRKNNDQMLSVLNNQFSCVKVEDTTYVRFVPDSVKTLPYVCRLAVPPFAGQFAGFVALFLTRAPSPADVDSLKIELTRISIEMYLRDIDKRSHG